jgi:hypothetical protein
VALFCLVGNRASVIARSGNAALAQVDHGVPLFEARGPVSCPRS